MLLIGILIPSIEVFYRGDEQVDDGEGKGAAKLDEVPLELLKPKHND